MVPFSTLSVTHYSRSQIKIPVVIMRSSEVGRFLSIAKLPSYDELELDLTSQERRKYHPEL
jgi:hypothetical protein